jgi:hypothetical protein
MTGADGALRALLKAEFRRAALAQASAARTRERSIELVAQSRRARETCRASAARTELLKSAARARD